MITKEIKVYLGALKHVTTVRLSQYDTNWRFVFTVYNGDEVWTPPTGSTVMFEGRKADGTVVTANGSIDGSNVIVDCTEQISSASGNVESELRFAVDGKIVGTANFVIKVEKAPGGGHTASKDDFSAIDQLLNNALSTITKIGRIENIEDEISALSARMDTFASLPDGSTAGDAELLDIRVGADGKTYADAGTAVRSQVQNQADRINKVGNIAPTDLTWEIGKTISASGSINSSASYSYSSMTPVQAGAIIDNTSARIGMGGVATIVYVHSYNSEGTWLRRDLLGSANNYTVTLQNDVDQIRFVFGYAADSGNVVTLEDIITNFGASAFYKSARAADVAALQALLDNKNFLTVQFDNGVANEITENGYYWWRSSATPEDVPIDGAGMLLHFRSNDTIAYQIAFDYSANHMFYRVKRGGSSRWTEFAQVITASEIPSSMRPCVLRYSEGAYRGGDATKRANVYIPTHDGYIMIMFYFFELQESQNCEGWQIYNAYRANAAAAGATEITLTVTGEWECALHLAGRDDFSGGATHGDERQTSYRFFIDGVPLDSLTVGRQEISEFRLVQTSLLYDPSDHTTAIAEHGKEYIITADGMTINQSVKWLVSEDLTNCFLGMFTPSKNYTDAAYTDQDFVKIPLTSSDYAYVRRGKIRKITMSGSTGLFAEVTANEYPTGLPGGDQISLSDNGGLNYNKLYFKVCGEGATSQIDDIWRSSVTYKLDYKAPEA